MVSTRRKFLKRKHFYNIYMNYIRTPYQTVKKNITSLLIICFLIISIIYLNKGSEVKGIKDLKHDDVSEDLKIIAERMEQRRQHLTETCHKHGLDVATFYGRDPLHRPNSFEFLVNHEHKLVWCPVYKAAASSWMHNFNLLAGYSADYLEHATAIPMNVARKKYPHPTLKELNDAIADYVSFIIVRHPFERILSAYRDRVITARYGTDFAKLGHMIIRMYRPGAHKVYDMNNPKYPTFEEFVKYLAYVHKHKLSLNIHWTPVTRFCSPCLIHFDLILKFETFSDDQLFLIHQTGIGDIVKPIKLNAGKGETKDYIKEFYSQLNKEQIEKLYDMFMYDFEVFNYTKEDYLALART